MRASCAYTKTCISDFIFIASSPMSWSLQICAQISAQHRNYMPYIDMVGTDRLRQRQPHFNAFHQRVIAVSCYELDMAMLSEICIRLHCMVLMEVSLQKLLAISSVFHNRTEYNIMIQTLTVSHKYCIDYTYGWEAYLCGKYCTLIR